MSTIPVDIDRLINSCKKDDADSNSYIPAFFHLSDPAERTLFCNLISTTNGIQIVDLIRSQIGELIKIRNPAHIYISDELEKSIDKWIGNIPDIHYGVWVYYPWSKYVVHLLDENEFVEVRTNRNKYKITDREQDILRSKRVGIVGLSVGQAIALTIATERSCGEIRLADYDNLELSNLNRIFTGTHNLGINKVIIAARSIKEIDPFLQVSCYTEGITEENIDSFIIQNGKLDILFDECDGLDIKILLRQRAKKLAIPVVMETNERGMIDIERFDLEPERKIFHGLIDDVDYQSLRNLSNEEKIPFISKILGIHSISKRQKASLLEVGQSISTWPQLASSVSLGGALGAETSRRILLDRFRSSGRYFVNPEEIITDSSLQPKKSDDSLDLDKSDVQSADRVVEELHNSTYPLADEAIDLDRFDFDKLIESACFAPSGGNCQPWKWVAYSDRAILMLDPSNPDTLLDYENSASYVALGAAAENLVLQAHAQQLEVKMDSFPKTNPQAVAIFQFFHNQNLPNLEPHACDLLVSAIPVRLTNRKMGQRMPLPDRVLGKIEAAVETIDGANLHLLTHEDELAAIGELMGIGDRLRILYRPTHEEMMREIRWTEAEVMASRDGLDLKTLELSATDRVGLEVCRDWSTMELIAEWKKGKSLEKSASKLITSSSAVGLITMSGHSSHEYFAGGRAMQRAWLTASLEGLAFQPWTALPYFFARLIRSNGAGLSSTTIEELSILRSRYQQLFPVADTMGEILLFRLSISEQPTARSLRRNYKDCLIDLRSSKSHSFI
jgi:molybdopterin/thiamine biosynthesis adenylyltransferase